MLRNVRQLFDFLCTSATNFTVPVEPLRGPSPGHKPTVWTNLWMFSYETFKKMSSSCLLFTMINYPASVLLLFFFFSWCSSFFNILSQSYVFSCRWLLWLWRSVFYFPLWNLCWFLNVLMKAWDNVLRWQRLVVSTFTDFTQAVVIFEGERDYSSGHSPEPQVLV